MKKNLQLLEQKIGCIGTASFISHASSFQVLSDSINLLARHPDSRSPVRWGTINNRIKARLVTAHASSMQE